MKSVGHDQSRVDDCIDELIECFDHRKIAVAARQIAWHVLACENLLDHVAAAAGDQPVAQPGKRFYSTNHLLVIGGPAHGDGQLVVSIEPQY